MRDPTATDCIMRWLNSAENRTDGGFFVDNKIPFVANYCHTYKPFIFKNMPLVLFNGFTLIELIVTMVIVAVVVTLAVPEIRNIVQTNRITSQANSLISDIGNAKSHALGRGHVVLCTSSDGISCNGAGWNSGRLIFADATPNNFAFDPGVDRLIQYTEPLPAGSIEAASTNFPDPIIINSEGDLVTPLLSKVITLASAPGAEAPQFLMLCDVQRRVPGRTVEIRSKMSAVVSTVPPTCP